MYYMVMNQPWLRGVFGVTSPIDLWFGILPISAGVFGVPLGFAVIIIVSLFDTGALEGRAGTGRARALPERQAGRQGLSLTPQGGAIVARHQAFGATRGPFSVGAAVVWSHAGSQQWHLLAIYS